MRPTRAMTAIGVVTGIAAFTATAVLALTRHGAAEPNLPLAPLPTAGRLRQAHTAGSPGPESVPIPVGPALARARLVRAGERIDGVSCDSSEQVLFHIHAHLTIFVHGAPRQVPAGIGIGSPLEVNETPAGTFVTGGTCFMWLHTHSPDGVIHTESPIKRTYTLGDFFDVWGQPLNRHGVGPTRGPVTALFNGRLFTGDPRQIPLLAHAQIQLDVGRPLIAPEHISFPPGL